MDRQEQKDIFYILIGDDAQKLIDDINFYTPDEAKRCRLLLAKVLLILMDKPNEN